MSETTLAVTAFFQEFQRDMGAVHADLEATCAQWRAQATPEDPAAVSAAMAKLLERVQMLEKRLIEAAIFLPPYDQRQCLQKIKDAQELIAARKEEFSPKKRFAFGRRKGGGNSAAANEGSSTDNKETKEDPKPTTEASTSGVSDAAAPSTQFATSAKENVLEISGKRDFAYRGSNEANFDKLRGADVSLSNLANCLVFLPTTLSAVRMDDLRDCRVALGPASGSVFVDRCVGCTLVVACHQLRMHNSKDCQVYLLVGSNPIVEDCSGIKFAPYSLTYEALASDVTCAGLEMSKNKWSNVEDFNWLRQQQSPNWSILPVTDRKSFDPSTLC